MLRMKVYRYGLLEPTVGREIVDQQMRAAHRYANTLIEIERERREAVRAVQAAHDTVAPIVAKLTDLEAQLEAARGAIKARRSETRTRKGSPEEREAVSRIVAQLREARVEHKAARRALREDAVVAEQIRAANDRAHARMIEARAACGVYWGTYLIVEQAMDAARRGVMDPRFRRWTGDGAVAVELIHGLPLTDMLACADTRLRLSLEPVPVPDRGGKPLPRLRLRVGSEGRDPVWAEWPVIYHRPIPEGATIKWAKVVRRMVAARETWSLHLTIDTGEAAAVATSGVGAVAVDLGWRRVGLPALRAGGWADERGEAGEIMLSEAIEGQLRKAEDLRSIRDQHMNEVRAELVAWRDADGRDLPEEHRERLTWLPQWRSPARFAGLAIWWRDHRAAGDESIFVALEAWRKRDKHLWQWEANARRKALARRRDTYRCLAAQLARAHDVLVLERLDLRALAAIPKPESERDSNPRQRAQRFDTAPSELRLALENAFRREGGRIVTVPPMGPASALLEAYRERSGVEEKPAIARVSRFSKLRAKAADGASPSA